MVHHCVQLIERKKKQKKFIDPTQKSRQKEKYIQKQTNLFLKKQVLSKKK
jgi:hypothetical protein